LKGKKTAEVSLNDGASVQNIPPSTSWPKEGMPESYMAISSFSELLTVIVQRDDKYQYNHWHKEFNDFFKNFAESQHR
jgi:hypothetical protein